MDEKKRNDPVRTAVTLIIAAVLLVTASGFYHVIYGGSVGFKIIRKDAWSLSDTVADLGKIEQSNYLMIIGEGRVNIARALIRERIIRSPTD